MSDINITVNDEIVNIDVLDTPVYVEVTNSPGQQGPAGVGVPVGGTTGQVLSKASATNYDTVWVNASGGGVPYSGATGNVNLGEYELKAGQLTLDVSPTGTAAVGTTRWNDTTGVSETTLKGGNVLLRNGVDLVARVVNKVTPNTTLTKAAYQAVRVSGAQGQRLAVAFAQANNDANSADTIGLVIETIPTNQEGFIMAVGQLENINTTGSLQGETWVDGDVLYLSPTTAGAITKVKPTGNGHIVVIGYVEYAHANNGKIYIKILNGWELTELHDVDIVSPSNNEALIYESATSLWKNKTIATALGYTPANAATTLTINGVTYDLSTSRTWTVSAGISGSGTSGQVTYWSGSSAVSGSTGLTYNDSTGFFTLTKNQNTNTRYTVQNTFVGSSAVAEVVLQSTTVGSFGKVSSTYVPFKTLGASDFFMYNGGAGDMTFLNDFATGRIKFASGGVSTSQMTLFANGNLAINSGVTDLGVRFGVVGDTLLRGSGSTISTTALTVQNSSSTNLLRVLNNGDVSFGADAMYWDAVTSRLGIGTNAPAADLHINSTFASSSFRITRSGVSATDASFEITTGTTTAGQLLPVFLGVSNYSVAGNTIGLFFTTRITNGSVGDIGLIFEARKKPDGSNPIGSALTQGWIASFRGYTTDYVRISHLGNMVLQNGGTFSDGGQRLQVIGDTLLRGSGATSATTALTVQNSSSTVLGRFQNDGAVSLGAGGWLTIGEGGRYLYKSLNLTSIFTICNDSTVGASIDLYGSSHATNANRIFLNGSQVRITSASVLMTALPTSSAGLPSGALWNNGGVINIV